MFETELFICIKMYLALITYNGWCVIKPNQTIYQVACRFFSNKIQLVSSSTSFSQTFSPDLPEKKFCHWRENEKRWKWLGARSSEYGGSGRTDKHNSNTLFLVNVTLRYHGEAQRFSYWRVYFEVSDIVLKSQNEWYPYDIQHTIFSIKLRFMRRLWRFILVCPLPFALNLAIKDAFFVSRNDMLEERVISLPWKKTTRNEYDIFLILFTKSMKNWNAELSHFSYHFRGGQLWIGK